MDDAEPTVDVARFLSVLLMYFYSGNIEPNLRGIVFGAQKNEKLLSEEEMGKRVNLWAISQTASLMRDIKKFGHSHGINILPGEDIDIFEEMLRGAFVHAVGAHLFGLLRQAETIKGNSSSVQ